MHGTFRGKTAINGDRVPPSRELAVATYSRLHNLLIINQKWVIDHHEAVLNVLEYEKSFRIRLHYISSFLSKAMLSLACSPDVSNSSVMLLQAGFALVDDGNSAQATD